MQRSTTRARRQSTVTAASLVALALVGCAGSRETATDARLVLFEGSVMGTTYHVKLLADEALGDAAEKAVAEALTNVDDAMTTWRDSEVTRFNAAPADRPFALSAATADVVELALRLNEETGGAFDVTVGPLVAALGFGPTPARAWPTENELAALRESVGSAHLTLSDGSLVKDRAETTLDLSALAKGYGVDRATLALEALGIEDYMIEVGGEVRAGGRNESGRIWRIGIELPDSGPSTAVQRVVALEDLAMATSGDYRNYREIEGERVSHIVDPRTGATVRHRVASATVLHPDCATADGLATAMMVLGEDGLALAASRDWAVMLLVRAADGFVERRSPAFDRLLESIDEALS